MKKSQILAALALAFALGVVTPVASTYAQITDEPGVTDGQKEEVYDQLDILLGEVNKLEDYTKYTTLLGVLEGEPTSDGKGGTIKRVENWQKGWLLEDYNSAFTDSRNVNANIKEFNKILNDNAAAIKAAELPAVKDKAHDNFRVMAEFAEATSVDQAYAAVESAIEAVKLNLAIMNSNYDTSATVIAKINTQLAAINSYLTGSGAWKDTVNSSANGMFVDGGNTLLDINTLANTIKSIDFNAYNKMVKNADWTSTTAANITGMDKVRDIELIIDTATALPKYGLANTLLNAVSNAQLVAKTNGANIKYSNAVDYVSALNKAIEAYKTGKTDNGTGDGTNKPEEGGNKAPDTGILADAEGNASTTVAMVAGIATALTAAGAGVVAYRNARRSTRK